MNIAIIKTLTGFEPKHPIPGSFCNEFNKCNNQKPQKENREREKKTVYNNA